MTEILELKRLSKVYGSAVAVDDLSMQVESGELISLLGPSGCGKTTTLRMIAGFVEPTSGQVSLGGRDMTDAPPHKRNTGMVFQAYALFPHLTVAQNIAFGLKRRGIAKAEITVRVDRMIELLRLSGLSKRLPRQLSGGQQQRVAVGRALVIEPSILLLDEPFSNLDAKLRESTRFELRRLQQELALTTIFVTHDQEEAMAISDRIAVLNGGRLEQLGKAQEIYERPKTQFVTEFIGAVNTFRADVVGTSGDLTDLKICGGFGMQGRLNHPVGAKVIACLRPENIAVAPETETSGAINSVKGRVDMISYQGARSSVIASIDENNFLNIECESKFAASFSVGQVVNLSWPTEAVSAYPA